MTTSSSLVDELGKAALDARAAVREVHEAMRDARQVMKELEDAIARAKTAAHDAVDEDVTAIIKDMLDDMGEQTQEAMRVSVLKVGKEFDKLANIFLGRERDDARPPLETIVQRIKTREALKDIRYGDTL